MSPCHSPTERSTCTQPWRPPKPSEQRAWLLLRIQGNGAQPRGEGDFSTRSGGGAGPVHWESEARTATARPPWGRHSLLSVPVGKPHSWLCACRSRQGDSGALAAPQPSGRGFLHCRAPPSSSGRIQSSWAFPFMPLWKSSPGGRPGPCQTHSHEPSGHPETCLGRPGAELTQTLPQGLPAQAHELVGRRHPTGQ